LLMMFSPRQTLKTVWFRTSTTKRWRSGISLTRVTAGSFDQGQFSASCAFPLVAECAARENNSGKIGA
jgi:hypothetical protein